MTKASDNLFPRLLISEGGSTATPAAARVTVYAKADGLLYSKDDAGTETLVSGGPGGASEITDIPTAETDDTLVLAPDGAGGVEFRAEAGGAGSELPIDAAATAAVGSGDLFTGTSLDGGWTSLQSTAVTSVDRAIDGYCILTNTGNTSDKDRGIQRAFAPSADFTITAKITWAVVQVNYQWFGIFAGAADPSDGASGNRLECHTAWDGSVKFKCRKMAVGSETSVFNSTVDTIGTASRTKDHMTFPVWFRIKRVGTTLTAAISWDGVAWVDHATTTTIAFAVATCGIFIGETSTSADMRTCFAYIATTG